MLRIKVGAGDGDGHWVTRPHRGRRCRTFRAHRNRRLPTKGVIESRERATCDGVVDDLMIATVVDVQIPPPEPKTEMFAELVVQEANDLVVQVRPAAACITRDHDGNRPRLWRAR